MVASDRGTPVRVMVRQAMGDPNPAATLRLLDVARATTHAVVGNGRWSVSDDNRDLVLTDEECYGELYYLPICRETERRLAWFGDWLRQLEEKSYTTDADLLAFVRIADDNVGLRAACEAALAKAS